LGGMPKNSVGDRALRARNMKSARRRVESVVARSGEGREDDRRRPRRRLPYPDVLPELEALRGLAVVLAFLFRLNAHVGPRAATRLAAGLAAALSAPSIGV
jgi:hypothetical protein